MNKLMLMLVLIAISCKPVQDPVNNVNSAEVLLTYSKGQCLGRCPVYEVKILKDGMLIYNGINKVKQKGNVIVKLPSDTLNGLVAALQSSTEEPKLFKRVRDRPVTVLRYNKMEFEYHANSLSGDLKDINSTIEALVAQVNTK